MLAEVTGLIGSKNLKFNFFKGRWESGLPLELTRLAGIF